jgi:hypothetical protein
MKKLWVFLSLMALPLSAMAMAEISDQTLSDVTGQAGVSINVNLSMNVSSTVAAWGDPDGVGSPSTAGFIGIKNLNLTGMTINSQENLGADFRPLTIDVATDDKYGTSVTYAHYGMGTLKVGMPSQTVDVALGSTLGTDGSGLNQILGESYMNLTTLEFDPASYIDIWAGNIVNSTGSGGVGVGVNQTINIKLKTFNLNTVSWGDTDGLGAGSAAGFSGLRNLVLTSGNNPITVTGTMSTNTGTRTLGGASHTVVHIEYFGIDKASGFSDGFVVNVPGPITAEQVVATNKELTTGAGVLGDIYISSFKQVINKGSYVEIYPH